MRVVAIDDDQMYLNLLERYFSHEPDIEFLALKCEIGSTTLRAKAFDPDVVLVDLSMPFLPGVDLIQLMRRPENLPRAKFVILSGGDATRLRKAEIDTGARRAFSKSTELKHLVQLIRALGAERE